MLEAADEYDAARLGLGDEFLVAVEAGIELVAEAPARWPRVDRRHHRFVLRRFPFSILYRFNDQNLIVVAIAHHKRRPGFWSGRA